MDLFKYRAMDSNGNSFIGTIQSENLADARIRLQQGGFIVLELNRLSIIKKLIGNIESKKIGIKYLAVFCRQLHIVLKSGVSVLRGLMVMKQQTGDKKNLSFVNNLYQEVQKGRSLSEAIEDSKFQVPYLLIHMLSVGEESGNLEDVLLRMSVYYEKEDQLRSKIIASMIYPSIMALISVGLVGFFMTFVMPEILSVFRETEAELPAVTKVIIALSDFLKANIIWVILGIIGLIVGIRYAIPYSRQRIIRAYIVNKAPFIKTVVKDILTTRFLRNFGLLLRAGVPLVKALQIVSKIMDNITIEAIIVRAIEGVKRGERMGDNLQASNYFDPVVIHMINIGQETGELDNILDSVSEHYERQSEMRLVKLTAAMEPVMIVVLGVIMGFLIIAMVLPMFEMLGSLRGRS